MSDNLINVLVVDDHQLIIEGLKSMLQDETDIVFCGGANSMKDALDFAAQMEIDVMLLDVNMPDGSGIEVTRMFKQQFPHVKILALTMHEDISIISQMVEAGASGYLLKRTNMNEVLEAIRVVHNNGKYLGREVQSILMENLTHTVSQVSADSQQNNSAILTSREKEILSLVAREMSNEEIANKLFISERTVETHRRNIFTKTQTKSIVGLIKYAIKNGLISNEADTV